MPCKILLITVSEFPTHPQGLASHDDLKFPAASTTPDTFSHVETRLYAHQDLKSAHYSIRWLTSKELEPRMPKIADRRSHRDEGFCFSGVGVGICLRIQSRNSIGHQRERWVCGGFPKRNSKFSSWVLMWAWTSTKLAHLKCLETATQVKKAKNVAPRLSMRRFAKMRSIQESENSNTRH